MSHFLDVWVFGLIGAMLRYATPLVLAALGGLLSERAGVVNIALEGFMVVGAFFAIWGSVTFHTWVAGLIVAVLLGGALAALHAVASVTLRADQIISGTALILICGGLVDFLNLTIYGTPGSPPHLSRVPTQP